MGASHADDCATRAHNLLQPKTGSRLPYWKRLETALYTTPRNSMGVMWVFLSKVLFMLLHGLTAAHSAGATAFVKSVMFFQSALAPRTSLVCVSPLLFPAPNTFD
jgi:hypothetical protein